MRNSRNLPIENRNHVEQIVKLEARFKFFNLFFDFSANDELIIYVRGFR